ncbi:glycosyltransferase family 4 protein [Deinococcus sp. Marseille-Q6407]|uniref:glycosyltransferase family 4 protein n=1 Tax=Deinococcus sp. Marseille-Q6407 TaxID=2969223 RepID=UPI0021BE070A|nr:glycosyltransferase family 4 protein [Deinococcus sp. Marseille-Q6407]
MQPLNIVIYNITPPGGVERVAINLANMLVDTFQVNIVSLFSSAGQPFYPLDKRVQVTHLGVPFVPGLRHYLRQNTQALRALRQQVHFSPDTITLGMSVNMNLLLALLKRSGASGRFIGCEHMNYDDAGRVAQGLRRLTYPLLDEVVVLTEAEQRVFHERLGLKVQVIPNQLPLLPAQPATLAEKRLLAVGRYSDPKGFDRLLPAIIPLMRDFPDWRLDLFGKGEQEEDLKQQITQSGLSNIGLHSPTADVEREYLSSSVYLLPSRFEALPMVVLEAQACGLPVVAYDSSNGPRALVNSENGFLIPDGDGPAFAEAVRQLITDPELRRTKGAAARRDAMQFAPEVIRQKWLDLLRPEGPSHSS